MSLVIRDISVDAFFPHMIEVKMVKIHCYVKINYFGDIFIYILK